MGLFDTNGKSYYSSTTEAFLDPNRHPTLLTTTSSSSTSHNHNNKRGSSPARPIRPVKTHSASGTTTGGYFVRPAGGTHTAATSASRARSRSRPGFARTHSGTSSFFSSLGGGFGGGGSNNHNNNHGHGHGNGGFWGGGSGGSGSRSIFGGSTGGARSSYYGRQPRRRYVAYLVQKLQRMVRELWEYARRHPVKAFFAVVVPLISAGGAIHSLLKSFGIRLPLGYDLGALGGKPAAAAGAGGYYGSRGYESGGAGVGGVGAGEWMEGASGLISIAKAFM